MNLSITKTFGEERIRTVLGDKRVVQPHVAFESDERYGNGHWTFSANGWQGTGVDITLEMFKALQELVNNPKVIEYYNKLENNND